MRLHQSHLGVYGVGDIGLFVPASFPVPQIPVVVPGQGVGELVRAKYSVPQNPILDAQGLGDCGCGCGGHGKCGMGGIGTDLSDMISGNASFGTYAMYGGGALLLMWLLMGRGSGTQNYREARKKALQKVRDQYPSRGRRAFRAAAGAF